MPQPAFILAALLVLQAPVIAVGAGGLHSRANVCGLVGQPARDLNVDAVSRTRALVDQVTAASYPELKSADIRIRMFRSRSDYFKARFGLPQFFFMRMRYLVFVNPRAFELKAPEDGVRAIIAHELAHVAYYKRRARVRLVGLIRLTSKRFSAEFERRADLKAIALGYGEGLKEYRRWLYGAVPASALGEKRRNYFSPEEIDAILSSSSMRPELLEYWIKHVPMSLDQIRATK
jgi:hypothetical protein